MAVRQPVDELGLKGVVDGRPEGEAGLFAQGEVVGRDGARGMGLEPLLDVRGQVGAEGAQAVDGARDAVEGDALETDFADQLGGGDGLQGLVGGCGGLAGDAVQDGEGVGGVEGEVCGGLACC